MPDSDDSLDTQESITRRNVLSATAGGLAAGGLGVAQGGTVAAQSAETVTILHDSHFHGRFGDPTDDRAMDIARYQTLIDDLRSARENAVFLGIGDDLAPSIMGLIHEGEHMVEALNYLDPLAVGVGNHEFDFGIDVATERFADSTFPWVVANLRTPDGDPIPGTEPWITRDVGGVTLGVFGSGVRNFYDITDYPADYQAIDPVTASEAATAALKDAGADVVVLASHTNHSTHYEIAEAVDDLDAIVGSHSEVTMDEPEVHAGTVISEVGDEFDHLGELTLTVDGDLVDWQRHDPDVAALEPDDGMASIVSTWRDQLEAELGREYFTTDVTLDARFDTNYAKESALGNLICDLMMEYAEANAPGVDEVDAALQNAGGIRSNQVYGPGGITGLEWLDILPFPNTIVTMEVKGRTLQALLESQIAALPWSTFGAQQSVQVGGVQYEWSGHDGDGQVEAVYVQGEPLDPDTTYTFTTNSYVAGFDELADADVVHESDGPQGPITLDMLEAKGTVSPSVEHRILRVDARTDARQVTADRDRISVFLELPAAVEGPADGTFYAVTRTGDHAEAQGIRGRGEAGALRVIFDRDDLAALADTEEPDLRVFGGFDPDEGYYDYRDDDGALIDLPVAAAWDTFVLRGRVPADEVPGRPGR
ncbi:bifunctional metallophosphatase/5'-nucleotidase [Halostella sp. JP-L12]|uniref:bifunctional metallophosphatase/5'-nucleotidase n=1 Tax=Halostella TaxID=1843185 RepID=UPI000EF82A90|nr:MULTISPECIES: 5'-nucleotidase C-terminal domain-containing protein [Halostella]NHN46506.1 bifunctional metallophosphatase/5'-nucleotidase [Halostella sp. JP-L12]